MAHRILPFYNVDLAVGKSKSNKLEDVMLVQFFMKEIFDFKAPITSAQPFPSQPLVVNGVADQNTFDWILAFQKAFQAFGMAIHVDGIVDSARAFLTTKSALANSVYTISIFNNIFQAQQPNQFPKLWEHPRMPAPLATQLSIFIK